MSLVLSVIYAVSYEYHQSFVPCRHASVINVFIDSYGALTLLGSLGITENQT